MMRGMDSIGVICTLAHLGRIEPGTHCLALVAAGITGLGSEFVRAPRSTLGGEERAAALAMIKKAHASRPRL